LSHILFADHRNRLCWDRSSLTEIVKTGRWILLSSLVFAFGANIDRFVFGGYITATEFGLYVLALNLLLLVDAIASRVFSSVALAWLSEAARSSPDEFRKRLFQLRVPIDMAMIAMAGFLYVLGPSIVELLYDDRYLDAGRILQLLSFGLIFTRFGILNMAYVALGRAELMAAVHVVKLVSALVCLIIGVHFYGFTGGQLAVALHGIFPVLYMLWLNREIGLNKISHELLIPPIAWPIGYLAGSVVLALVARFLA
jgi:O-antigen/teichoic acid export membrane protein